MSTTAEQELTPAEAAARLGCCERTVRRLVVRGALRARRYLGRVLIDAGDVERARAGEPVTPTAPASQVPKAW